MKISLKFLVYITSKLVCICPLDKNTVVALSCVLIHPH